MVGANANFSRHRPVSDAILTLPLLATKTVSANIMVADDNLNIVYMNDAIAKLLRDAEADLKKELPH